MGAARWIAAALLLASSTAAATETAPPAAPVVIQTGVYLLNVGKLDVAAGTYTVDFYLSLRSEKDMGDPRFEFMNGRAASIDKLTDEPTNKLFRIQANLMANLDLRRFPWDEHDPPIIIESATRASNDVVFVADVARTAIDPAVIFVGWDVRGFDGVVAEHPYSIYKETYSQVTFRIHIARLVFISSLKTFLPVLCFLFIAFAALLVTLEKLDSRVNMNTAMLIASVMFHLSITSQLPPSAYLTIADKVLIATYVTIGLSLLLSVMMMRLMQVERVDAAKRLRNGAFRFIPAFAAVAYLAVAVFSR